MTLEAETQYRFADVGFRRINLSAMPPIRDILNMMRLHLTCHQKNKPDLSQLKSLEPGNACHKL